LYKWHEHAFIETGVVRVLEIFHRFRACLVTMGQMVRLDRDAALFWFGLIESRGCLNPLFMLVTMHNWKAQGWRGFFAHASTFSVIHRVLSWHKWKSLWDGASEHCIAISPVTILLPQFFQYPCHYSTKVSSLGWVILIWQDLFPHGAMFYNLYKSHGTSEHAFMVLCSYPKIISNNKPLYDSILHTQLHFRSKMKMFYVARKPACDLHCQTLSLGYHLLIRDYKCPLNGCD